MISKPKQEYMIMIIHMAPGRPDEFQTPHYAINPLLPYLKPGWRIWECACGKGNLVNAFSSKGFDVLGTDIVTGTDFMTCELPEFDCIVTNPPYRYKYNFMERCYALGKPFALLMPLTALETKKRQTLMRDNGVEIILLDRRINFETPNKVVKSSSWFATAWFTNGFGIGAQLTFAELTKD